MSDGSSSRGGPADIIDLDRYMRAQVRPSRPNHTHCESGLVVDAGGVGPPRGTALDSSLDSFPSPRAPPARHKRYSHDSGLSDGSYTKRRHRPHRRVSDTTKSRESSKRNESSASMREFRAVCEKALLEQQQQIAKVTELCERLAQPSIAPVPGNTDNTGRSFTRNVQNIGRNPKVSKYQRNITTSDSTEISSSSSTRFTSRRQYKPDSCKTYKIIMTKLDELSRVFAARGALAPHAAAPTPRVCRATLAGPAVQVIHKAELESASEVGERAGGVGCAGGAGCAGGVGRAGCAGGAGEARALGVAVAHRFDIAPVHHTPRCNIVAESVVRHSDSSKEDMTSHVKITPDLDDPIHFYAQAKRLQALHATTRRGEARAEATAGVGEGAGEGAGAGAAAGEGVRRSGSLCALCRGYWRALRRCLTHQLFGTCS